MINPPEREFCSGNNKMCCQRENMKIWVCKCNIENTSDLVQCGQLKCNINSPLTDWEHWKCNCPLTLTNKEALIYNCPTCSKNNPQMSLGESGVIYAAKVARVAAAQEIPVIAEEAAMVTCAAINTWYSNVCVSCQKTRHCLECVKARENGVAEDFITANHVTDDDSHLIELS